MFEWMGLDCTSCFTSFLSFVIILNNKRFIRWSVFWILIIIVAKVCSENMIFQKLWSFDTATWTYKRSILNTSVYCLETVSGKITGFLGAPTSHLPRQVLPSRVRTTDSILFRNRSVCLFYLSNIKSACSHFRVECFNVSDVLNIHCTAL